MKNIFLRTVVIVVIVSLTLQVLKYYHGANELDRFNQMLSRFNESCDNISRTLEESRQSPRVIDNTDELVLWYISFRSLTERMNAVLLESGAGSLEENPGKFFQFMADVDKVKNLEQLICDIELSEIALKKIMSPDDK